MVLYLQNIPESGTCALIIIVRLSLGTEKPQPSLPGIFVLYIQTEL